MTKELIISANVHEKKVAMLEDGVVTEFYVERRDENQGVVGNLYKGRVMKVLPGMQSAFVDIGLERDAFLYVSDFTEFMEEEEEIDFREVSEEPRVPPRIDDRSRRGDRPRPEPVSAAARPAPARELAREEEAPAERPVRIEDAVEQLAEIADESMIPPPPPEDELPELEPDALSAVSVEAFPIERVTDDELAQGEATSESAEQPAQPEAAEPKRGRGRKPVEPRKKVTRPEEKQGKGAARKAAPKTPAKRSRRRGEDEEPTDSESALQFQREPEPEWRVGSFRSAAESGSGFQRVVDEIAEAAAREEASRSNFQTEQEDTMSGQLEETKASPFRHISDVVRGLYGRIQSGASGETSEASERTSSHESLESDSYPGVSLTAPETSGESTETHREPSLEEDRDAEVRDRGPRGEFAVRRGGRGRRGRGGRREPPAPAPGTVAP